MPITPVGRLAVTTEDGPYVVAVNYLFLEGNIYFHSGQAGRKMEALRVRSARVLSGGRCRASGYLGTGLWD